MSIFWKVVEITPVPRWYMYTVQYTDGFRDIWALTYVILEVPSSSEKPY